MFITIIPLIYVPYTDESRDAYLYAMLYNYSVYYLTDLQIKVIRT